MRRATLVKEELAQIGMVGDITGVFESIASLHISRIRGRVVASKDYFAELWQIYTGLRVDTKDRLKNRTGKNGRHLLLAVTSDSKFGGSSNDRVLDELKKAYDTTNDNDIMVIGSYGSSWLARHKMPLKASFAMPAEDSDINVSDAIEALNAYDKITVFYQTYDSLRVQKATRIDLVSTVRQLGEDTDDSTEVLSAHNFIFEPNTSEIADYLESVMMSVALIQVIMETKLADYAARFNTMTVAKQRAGQMVIEYRHEYYRSKRAENDERLNETIKAVRGITNGR